MPTGILERPIATFVVVSVTLSEARGERSVAVLRVNEIAERGEYENAGNLFVGGNF